jgi:SNF2 family DNA or RNA helicase
MTAVEVEQAKHRFQEESLEDAPVIAVSLMAGGTGHTLTASHHALILELPWSSTDLDQAIARAHRLGQEQEVQATYLIGENTIDTVIWAMLEAKRRVVGEATEGGRDGLGDLFMKLVRNGLAEARQ